MRQRLTLLLTCSIPQPPLVESLVGEVLLQGQLRTAGLLRRHEDLHLRECERQEAQIQQQPTPGWEQYCSARILLGVEGLGEIS
jgi:hypothetical protein